MNPSIGKEKLFATVASYYNLRRFPINNYSLILAAILSYFVHGVKNMDTHLVHAPRSVPLPSVKKIRRSHVVPRDVARLELDLRDHVLEESDEHSNLRARWSTRAAEEMSHDGLSRSRLKAMMPHSDDVELRRFFDTACGD